jgi:glycosyltransferase involved in cell wall biosynthesis
MTKLSIIVPVYNVEEYIRPCIESIFRQGLDDSDFEVIIVNDGTEDRSMEEIADIIGNHDNVTVINQENQGLSAARNNGIAVAKGEYILMPDPDDLLIKNSVPSLLKLALDTKADIVVANFLEMDNDEIANYKHHPQDNISTRELTGEQLFIEELNPHECYVWRSLFRKEFLSNNHISFYPRIKFQDVPFTNECYLKAKRCIRTSQLLNIYRQRAGSATAFFNLYKAYDFGIAIVKTWQLSSLCHSPQLLEKFKNDMFTRLTLAIYFISQDECPLSEKKETIRFIKELAPDMTFKDNAKQRIFSFVFQHFPMLLIYLRYLYGKIFDDFVRPTYRYLIKTKRNQRKQ